MIHLSLDVMTLLYCIYVLSIFLIIFSGETSKPSKRNFAELIDAEAIINALGIEDHSTCHWPVALSWSRTIASNIEEWYSLNIFEQANLSILINEIRIQKREIERYKVLVHKGAVAVIVLD